MKHLVRVFLVIFGLSSTVAGANVRVSQQEALRRARDYVEGKGFSILEMGEHQPIHSCAYAAFGDTWVVTFLGFERGEDSATEFLLFVDSKGVVVSARTMTGVFREVFKQSRVQDTPEGERRFFVTYSLFKR